MNWWYRSPIRLAIAYNVENIWQIGTDNPHLTWRQAGAKAGLPLLEKHVVNSFRVYRSRSVSPFKSEQYRYDGTDVGYAVQMYCKWWGKRYPMRTR